VRAKPSGEEKIAPGDRILVYGDGKVLRQLLK
jgi:Trk K+ transport system NAD-binding subunit